MDDVVNRIDRLLADLKRHYDRGGLTYGEAVLLDDMISVFERIRAARAAEDRETSLPHIGRDGDRELDGGRAR